MSKKAYGEFMKRDSSNKKKIGDLKLVSRRDDVYGRVLELEKLFFYSDDLDEDASIVYILGKDLNDLTDKQLQFHDNLMKDPEGFLETLEKRILKGKSKLIKIDGNMVLLSSMRYVYVQPNGDVVTDMYGYYGEGKSKPSMDDYDYYYHV